MLFFDPFAPRYVGNTENTFLQIIGNQSLSEEDTKILIELIKDIDVDAQDNRYQRTLLHWAAIYGHTNVVEMLIGAGASIDAKDLNNSVPLHLATTLEHTEIIKILLINKASVESKDNTGMTALHWAVYHNKIDTVEMLLINGASINVQDNNDATPLHNAAGTRSINIIRMLLSAKARIDIKDKTKETPLLVTAIASFENNLSFFNEFLEIIINTIKDINKFFSDFNTCYNTQHKNVDQIIEWIISRPLEFDIIGEAPARTGPTQNEVIEWLETRYSNCQKVNDITFPNHKYPKAPILVNQLFQILDDYDKEFASVRTRRILTDNASSSSSAATSEYDPLNEETKPERTSAYRRA